MTDVTFRKMPHGQIPFQAITNAVLRDVLMKMNENMVALEKTAKELVQAVNELKRRQ